MYDTIDLILIRQVLNQFLLKFYTHENVLFEFAWIFLVGTY